MAKDTFRVGSKKDWTSPKEGSLSREQIGVGCLQRIADALEQIAETQKAIVNEASEAQRLRRQVRALRGVITRQKRQGEPS